MADNTPQNQKPKPVLAVAGSTGLKRFGGYVHEEWLPQIAGTKAVKVYREMKDNDPIIGAILYAIKMLIRQVDWRVEACCKNPTPEQQAAADFVEECRDDMQSTWQEFLAECLDMLPFGWSFFETTHKIRRGRSKFDEFNSKFNDGKIGWRDFAVRGQESLNRWEFSPNGTTLGMWQLAPPDYRNVFLPMDKCMLFRVEAAKGNPEGRSILRNAYRSWYFLKRIQEIEAIGIERDLAGLPKMELPPEVMAKNASSELRATRAHYEDMVRKIRRDHLEGLVVPSELDREGKPTGFKFSLVQSGGRRPIDVDAIVRRYESRIAISVLGEFVLLGTDKHGSFALADNKTDLFAVALGAILASIVETINRVAIPRLMELNGILLEHCPKLVHGDVETPSLTEFMTAVTQATGAGLVTPDDDLENHVREYLGLPPRKAPELGEGGANGSPMNGPRVFTPADNAALHTALGVEPPQAPALGTPPPEGQEPGTPPAMSPKKFTPEHEAKLRAMLGRYTKKKGVAV